MVHLYFDPLTNHAIDVYQTLAKYGSVTSSRDVARRHVPALSCRVPVEDDPSSGDEDRRRGMTDISMYKTSTLGCAKR